MLPLLLAAFALFALGDDADQDGDGLSDFHEVHKHLTDPANADSDGDGVPDGDWRERREFQYTVRSVVQVMRPVTPEFLTDDYQDARVLDETETYVELEVIHYPFNTVADALEANRSWRRPPKDIEPWLEPGPSSDWTPALRRRILRDLERDDIDVAKLDDREAVERVSRWLVQRTETHDGFTAFITAFDDDGRPYVPDELRGERSAEELERQFEREVSAAGMYEHATRGSCSSSAIYLSGCLRAVGIPTRTVLTIPIVDAGDEGELDLVRRGIRHPAVRAVLLDVLPRLEHSWSSHTFNEVWVGERWRRLDYDVLGRGIFGPERFGLLTHVATFHDWADAEMPRTIGRRQTGPRPADVFGGHNPYSTISLRDEFGPHFKGEAAWQLHVERFHWSDSDELPGNVRDWMKSRDEFGLVAHVSDVQSGENLSAFLGAADRRLSLEARDQRLDLDLHPSCSWGLPGGDALVFVPVGRAVRERLRAGVTYRVVARNARERCAWVLAEGASVRR